jgi:hypothetical protein
LPEFNAAKQHFEKLILNEKSESKSSFCNQTSSLNVWVENDQEPLADSIVPFNKYFQTVFDVLNKFDWEPNWQPAQTTFDDLSNLSSISRADFAGFKTHPNTTGALGFSHFEEAKAELLDEQELEEEIEKGRHYADKPVQNK